MSFHQHYDSDYGNLFKNCSVEFLDKINSQDVPSCCTTLLHRVE